MMMGIAAQIIFGNLVGLVHVYEWHITLRWLTAFACAMMNASGSMICKSSSKCQPKSAFS